MSALADELGRQRTKPLPTHARHERAYLLIEEAAELARASVKTVRHWLLIGKLKGRKPGRRVLISRVELLAFIEGER